MGVEVDKPVLVMISEYAEDALDRGHDVYCAHGLWCLSVPPSDEEALEFVYEHEKSGLFFAMNPDDVVRAFMYFSRFSRERRLGGFVSVSVNRWFWDECEGGEEREVDRHVEVTECDNGDYEVYCVTMNSDTVCFLRRV